MDKRSYSVNSSIFYLTVTDTWGVDIWHIRVLAGDLMKLYLLAWPEEGELRFFIKYFVTIVELKPTKKIT